MRIIAGKYRHLTLDFPISDKVRPTKDRIRESIFASLGELVNERVCLDLFAGSGAYAFESLSRGAKCAYLVDNFKPSILAIKSNIKRIKCDNAYLIENDYLEALNYYYRMKIKFSLVFLDPPYELKVILDIIRLMNDFDLLTDDAIIVAETDYELNIDESLYKKTRRLFYRPAYLTILYC